MNNSANPTLTSWKRVIASSALTLALAMLPGHAAFAQKPITRTSASGSHEAQLAQIRANLRNGNVAKALKLAEDLSAKNSNDAHLHLALGLLLASEKQLKPAQLELEKADALQPEDFETLEGLGGVLLAEGQFNNAELISARALKLQPESPAALYLLAQTYTRESRPLDALDLLVRANKADPRNVDVLFLMAQISIAQKYFEDAIPLLEKGLLLAPQRVDLRTALGESYFKSDKIDKCIAEFEKVIAIEPNVRAYAYLGLAYSYLGRFDEAKEQFRKGLKLDPHDDFSLFHLGYVAERQGDNGSARALFEKVLASNPKFPYALLELANLDIQNKQYAEAAAFLKRYLEVSPDSASGYYKLSMVERGLHDKAAADRDLAKFQALSKDSEVTSHPYEHLFDYIETRSKLDASARNQMELAELVERTKSHPDEPESLYLLAQAYLKAGKPVEARTTIARLDEIAAADARTLTGAGVLLARYRLFDDAIRNFKAALETAPGSNEIAFDLADAYFRKGAYADALAAAQQVSEAGRNDDAYLALLADIYAHMGDLTRAAKIYQDAIDRNPDNDQDYLSLALLDFRQNNIAAAKQVLHAGQARLPGSGKILWGLGLSSALEGNTTGAGEHFEQAVSLLPEWPGSYSTLGVFYYQTGQIEKAREVLDRFRNSNVRGALDISRIEQVLAQAPSIGGATAQAMNADQSRQFLQIALYLADKTL